MSMHEFEDLVEESIRLLDARCDARLAAEFSGVAAATPPIDVRSFFRALYAFQDRWDTGFTHFRVIGILVKHRFAYVFDLEEHPDYPRLGRGILGDEGMSILRDPTRPWDAEENPRVGYACDPAAKWGPAHAAEYPPELQRLRLYCDAGSELWQRFVDAGKLVGPDAIAPDDLPIAGVAARIAQEAEMVDDKNLVRGWMALLFADRMQDDLVTLQGDPSIRALREVAKRMGIVDRNKDYGDIRVITDEDLEDMPDEDVGEKVRWWFAVTSDE
jgi:hypothetical protein